MIKTDNYEIRDDRFERSVKLDEPIEQIWTGGKWTEGPVYSPAFRCLIFSDIPNDRRLRWDELSGTVCDIRSGLACYTNGSTLDRQGRIVACEHGTRSVTRIEHDGSVTVLASHFEGKRFNSPNDVVVRSDDTIWFSDPAYGIESDYEGFQAEPELDGEHVYRLVPSTGDVTQVTSDFACPNGLAFSLDEKTLYIADSGGTRYPNGGRHIRKFYVGNDGTLSGGTVFAECEEGVFDGFRLDTQGRIWTSARDGVHCYHPDGSLLGKIFVPEEVSNVCFGGLKRNRLFITASKSLYSVLLATTGASLL
ncbi:gluconolactonase [Pseudooceanicola antarcticus]|uniref:Gluconolactonase n=1 Tax=Pseudooceanicola antarcticus TaxID=1247613 RepID=A0A285IJ22_9RHOB|nr:SMP-30/gluconolactonase/LRE family protein [Pseudooceanicola antarcticus]PJE28859.1 gluconolactonase [Pseudooceanicola antarcticus]SNY47968.1 gluconolactonase [Pseudooceanicola antarcticus]